MTLDSLTPRSRRNLLVTAFGGVAGAVAVMISRAAPVAADSEVIHVGDNITTAASVTAISNRTNDATVLFVGTEGSGTAVLGASSDGIGVRGDSDNSDGVRGVNAVGSGAGVHGISLDEFSPGQGVFGEASGPTSVAIQGINRATSGKAIGARATSSSPTGLGAAGWAKAGGVGVMGVSGSRFPAVPPKTGVYGYAPNGRGGLFRGKEAQIRLVASSETIHPTTGLTGDLFLDAHTRLWFCRGGTTWVRLA